jgi:hypothetical protein
MTRPVLPDAALFAQLTAGRPPILSGTIKPAALSLPRIAPSARAVASPALAPVSIPSAPTPVRTHSLSRAEICAALESIAARYKTTTANLIAVSHSGKGDARLEVLSLLDQLHVSPAGGVRLTTIRRV